MNNLVRLTLTSCIALLTAIVFAAEPSSPPRTGEVLATEILQRVETATGGVLKRVAESWDMAANPLSSFEVGQRPVQHAGNGDFITDETGFWGVSALTVGLNAEFYRAAAPRQRVQVAMQRAVRMYHDQTTRPRAVCSRRAPTDPHPASES